MRALFAVLFWRSCLVRRGCAEVLCCRDSQLNYCADVARGWTLGCVISSQIQPRAGSGVSS